MKIPGFTYEDTEFLFEKIHTCNNDPKKIFYVMVMKKLIKMKPIVKFVIIGIAKVYIEVLHTALVA